MYSTSIYRPLSNPFNYWSTKSIQTSYYLCLVGKTSEPNTILLHSRSYQLLWYQRHLWLQGAMERALGKSTCRLYAAVHAAAVDKLVRHAVVLVRVVLVVWVLLYGSVQYLYNFLFNLRFQAWQQVSRRKLA